jgi:hypothetical protein
MPDSHRPGENKIGVPIIMIGFQRFWPRRGDDSVGGGLTTGGVSGTGKEIYCPKTSGIGEDGVEVVGCGELEDRIEGGRDTIVISALHTGHYFHNSDAFT